MYGDFDPIPWLDRFLYVPDVAVGRLVETPAQINAALDQYRDPAVDGVLDLDTALTAGYGAWADGAGKIGDVLSERGITTTHLSPDNWTKADLLDQLFPTGGESPDVAAINAHMDPSRLLTGSDEEIDTADYDFDRLSGRLLFTLGCHAGLNLPQRYLGAGADDWAEELGGRAVYVGNTGYGYADGKVVGLTERLLALYAGGLGGEQTVGQALMFAKQAYVGGLGLYTNYDEKVLMEATFYGLPMYTFADPVSGPVGDTPPTTATDPATGLQSASFDFDPDFQTETVDGETFTVVDGEDPQVSPDRPILPRTSAYATVTGATAHDALITELTTTVNDAVPGIATADVSGAPPAEPSRFGSVSFPSAFTNVTSYETPDGTRQDVVLLPAHVTGTTDPVTGEQAGSQELFTHTGVQVFYGAADDHRKPTITEATATRDGSTASFELSADDASTVKRVVVLYQTTDGGAWHALDSADGDLTRTGTVWSGDAPVGAGGTLRWIAQAVDGAGNVAISTNRGEMNVVSATAPSFDAGPDASIESGEQFLRTVAIDDPDSTRWSATLDTGRGPEPVDVLGNRVAVDVHPSRPGVITAVLEVCDDGNRCTSDEFELTVDINSAPYADVALSAATPYTNQTLTATATSTDPEGDPLTRRFVWKVNGVTVRDSGSTTAATDALNLSTAGNGNVGDEITVEVTASDGELVSEVDRATATVVSTAPVVTLPPTATADAGEELTLAGSASDVDGGTLTGSVDYGDGSDPASVPVAANGSFSLHHVYADGGTYDLTMTVTDAQGEQGVATSSVEVTGSTPTNQAPTVNAGADNSLLEGQTLTATGTYNDPDGDPVTGTVDWGDGSAVQSLTLASGSFTLSHVYRDNGARTLTVRIADGNGGEGTDTMLVSVANRAPVVASVSGPASPVTRGTSTSVTSSFSDPGAADTHTVQYAWGDGTTSNGTVSESNGSGTTSGSHVYTAAGTYPVTVTVTDDDGAAASATYEFIAISDNTMVGFGSGTYASPARAYPARPTERGTGRFAFVTWRTRVNGQTRLNGEVDFAYAPTRLAFNGTTVAALASTSSKVTMTVRGSVNGTTGYTMVLTAIDGNKRRPVVADLVRVRITRTIGGAVVYDSRPGANATAAPNIRLATGQIRIP